MSFAPTTPGVIGLAYPPGSEVRYFEGLFTENGAHTYTWTLPIPAGATVLDVMWSNQALWSAATSATLDIGDGDGADTYTGSSVNTKTTPGIDDAALEGNDSLHAAGKTKRYPNGGKIIAKIVSVGAGATGQTTVGVLMVLPSTDATPVIS